MCGAARAPDPGKLTPTGKAGEPGLRPWPAVMWSPCLSSLGLEAPSSDGAFLAVARTHTVLGSALGVPGWHQLPRSPGRARSCPGPVRLTGGLLSPRGPSRLELRSLFGPRAPGRLPSPAPQPVVSRVKPGSPPRASSSGLYLQRLPSTRAGLSGVLVSWEVFQAQP